MRCLFLLTLLLASPAAAQVGLLIEVLSATKREVPVKISLTAEKAARAHLVTWYFGLHGLRLPE